MKNSDTKERLKALMRKHTEDAAASASNGVATSVRPPPSALSPMLQPVTPTPSATVARLSTSQEAIAPVTRASVKPQRGWERVTVRLMNHELEKLNSLVIATQQANRVSKVTSTDVLRIALRRMEDSTCITAAELQALRAEDGRIRKARAIRA